MAHGRKRFCGAETAQLHASIIHCIPKATLDSPSSASSTEAALRLTGRIRCSMTGLMSAQYASSQLAGRGS
eukprot:6184225-Pleurochrysis_carterae.AAC.2